MAFVVTTQAATVLKQLLDKAEHTPDQVIRLVSGPEGKLKFALDTQKEDDQRISHNGVVILVLEPSVRDSLADQTLEVVQTEKGRSWILSDTNKPDARKPGTRKA
jgi:hypothetical protein